MRIKFIVGLVTALVASCLFSFTLYSQSVATVGTLRTEYLQNPVGLDALNPRLTWRISDQRQGAQQVAYEICVGMDSVAVSQGKGVEWVKQNTGRGQLIKYGGTALQPFTKYYWSVRITDQLQLKTAWAVPASFETGMIDQRNWTGSWISDGKSINEKNAPYFRTEFIAKRKIKSARAYVAAAGLYELYLNGERVGDHRLDPMYTRFDRRVLYVTYDVTAQLQEDKNAIGIVLGNGWYNHQSTAVWDFHRAPWRARPAFCLDLRITYDDGTTEVIGSGRNWKTSGGAIVFNSIYTAEHHDARREQTGWNKIGFIDTAWKSIAYRAAPADKIIAQTVQPIRYVETIAAKSLNKISDTVWVFDLGRNISGVSEIKLKGLPGQVIKLRHAERLYASGRVDQSNIDVHYRPTDDKDPFQTDIYTLKGAETETFAPHFNYKGFQYVEVTSHQPLQLSTESLVGYFMHSDVPAIGQLQTSSTTLNKIWYATNNSYLSNLFGYFTDCPQREKNGWTGDAQIASETGLYNFDAITIYEKWMKDHQDEQQPNGVLPSIIPTGGWGYEWGNGPDWTSTIAIIPYNIYLFYGDTSLLSSCYDNIKRYVDHITEISPTGLTTWGLGDWIPVKSETPVEFTSTAYYYTDVKILATAAKLFGKTEDAAKYAALSSKIFNAFNTKYYNPATGIYNKGVQTEMSVPLQWGLVPDSVKARVAANLARRVALDSNHIDVGLLGTKAILNALSENGYADVAYKLASNEDFPSWGFWIKNGATTLYENWPIKATSDISMNHIMFGEIGAWYYKALAGIRADPEQPGFKNIKLEPNFVRGLDQVEASHESPYGIIKAGWTRKNNKMNYRVTIPPNSTADFKVPVFAKMRLVQNGEVVKTNADNVIRLEAGTYLFEWKK